MLHNSLAGSIQRGGIIVTIQAAAMLGLLTFRELLMCLEEEERSIGSCVRRVIGGIGVP
jgi:hypothetical protein